MEWNHKKPSPSTLRSVRTRRRLATLALGSNLEPRGTLLAAARLQISQHIGPIHAASSLYKSEPWGFQAKEWFYNQVITVHTALSAMELLTETQRIEQLLGRTVKTEKPHARQYTSRTVDIDILLIEGEIHQQPLLTVPHPRTPDRLFVLLPLREIDPHGAHPTLGSTWEALVHQCPDRSKIYLLS